MNNDFKMPIVLIGNSFKYEIEATVKMFFSSSTRFEFLCFDDERDSNFDKFNKNSYIIAEVNLDHSNIISAEVCIDGKFSEDFAILPLSADTKTIEHELCRLIYHLLCKITNTTPSWGLMTGIRPVKKVTELIEQGKNREEIKKILTEKYELSDKKFNLAYQTALNQLPILEKINPSAVSLYISIPFCPTRCSYCSFVSHSIESAAKLMPDYVSALCKELEIISHILKDYNVDIDTVYFGGGTPTALCAEDIATIMGCLQKNFDINKVREYSFEAGRPDTITEEKLKVIKSFGADRISVNPQTLNDEVLKVIGRKHSSEQFLKAFETARKIGFKNINTDLIAGLPTDTPENFRDTLDRIITLDPESITVHTLTLKRSSTLFRNDNNSNSNSVAEMVDYSIERLMKNGYNPYYMYRQKNTVDNLENVGYAKKGFENWYNIFIMDETQTIIGAGSGASTKLVYPEGRIERVHNYKYPYEYISNFEQLMTKKKEISECLKKIKST